MLSRKPCFLLLILCTAPLLAGGFQLEQISSVFESTGFEDQIDFWVQIYTRYGETDVVFHDRRDLRLIYDVMTVDRAPGQDRAEAKRQRKLFEDRADRLAKAFRELAKGESPEGDPERARLVGLLTKNGYEITPELCSQLAEKIRFQRGIKEKFREGVIRSGRYLAEIERIFAAEGLPEELAMLPHVESSFDYDARSKVGAAGIWQFVRGTGRLYLRINRSVDERLDPIRSTQAAARLLKDNYEVLGSWPLAVVAYNHGRYGMLRAQKQHGNDLAKIVQEYESRSFGFASRNFYPEFLAAVLVARNWEDYFAPLELLPPLQYGEVSLQRATPAAALAQASGVSLDELKEFNPHFTSRTWRRSLPAGLTVRMPVGSTGAVLAMGTAAASTLDARKVATGPAVTEDRADVVHYRVQRGDTLNSIAQKFGVGLAPIEAANQLDNRNRIYPGQKLVIPSSSQSPRPVRYRVKRGDTLQAIARRFRTTLTALTESNGIIDPHRIALGQVLLIPVVD